MLFFSTQENLLPRYFKDEGRLQEEDAADESEASFIWLIR